MKKRIWFLAAVGILVVALAAPTAFGAITGNNQTQAQQATQVTRTPQAPEAQQTPQSPQNQQFFNQMGSMMGSGGGMMGSFNGGGYGGMMGGFNNQSQSN